MTKELHVDGPNYREVFEIPEGGQVRVDGDIEVCDANGYLVGGVKREDWSSYRVVENEEQTTSQGPFPHSVYVNDPIATQVKRSIDYVNASYNR